MVVNAIVYIWKAVNYGYVFNKEGTNNTNFDIIISAATTTSRTSPRKYSENV
jgi:hypothetical protein